MGATAFLSSSYWICFIVHFVAVTGYSSNTQAAGGGDTQLNTVATTASASIPENVVITKISHSTFKSETLKRFLRSDKADAEGGGVAATVDLIGASYIAHVSVGSQIVPLLIDTGSSDIWVVPSSFVCLDSESNVIEQSACGFPSFIKNTFSGGAIPDEYLSIIYGNGQFAYGPFGFESVSLGGIKIPNQQIAMLSEGYIEVATGDFSGILGLGYPGMVAARKGKEPKHYINNTDPYAAYDTWLVNAVNQNLTAPLFSLALDMDGGGLLAIGGAVDVPIQGDFAATPILMLNLINDPRADTDLTYYTIIADDYFINGERFSELSKDADTPSGKTFPVVVDSGFTTCPLPPSLVTLFYNAFIDAPLPVDIEGHPMIAAPCNTPTVPGFGIQIDGQIFHMTRETLLVSRLNATENGTLMCAIGLQPGIEEAGLLGDTFLSNVIAVFDVGASEMRFAQRSFKVSANQEPSGLDARNFKDEL